MLSPHPPGGPSPGGARVDRASLAGGSRGSRTDAWSTTQAWCFPLKEAAWRPVAPMLKARTNHASAALNGEIYVVGGKTPPCAPPPPPHPGPHPGPPAPTPILPPPPPHPPTRASWGAARAGVSEPSSRQLPCFLGRREQDKESVPRPREELGPQLPMGMATLIPGPRAQPSARGHLLGDVPGARGPTGHPFAVTWPPDTPSLISGPAISPLYPRGAARSRPGDADS